MGRVLAESLRAGKLYRTRRKLRRERRLVVQFETRMSVLPDSHPLDYEATAHELQRRRAFRRLVPDTSLGFASCFICVVSIALSGLLIVLAMAGFEATPLLVAAGLSLPLCVCGGVPLAIGGLADVDHRRRFAVIGLIANVAWPCLVVLFLLVGSGR
jgi:hypothetical protein